jgi:nucleotide-binding universal stress UspA family protein
LARGPVIACVNDARDSRAVVRAAAEYAQSFEQPLILYHVLEHEGDPSRLPDPFEWNLRRQEVSRELDRLREGLPDLSQDVLLELDEGDWVTALGERDSAPGTLLVVGAPQTRASRPGASRTARLLAEAHPGSVLLVPGDYAPRAIGPTRIAVPIDGSNFAEAALVEAARLARRLDGELLLIHVVPDAGLAEFGPPATSDLELRLAVDRRNEQAACTFLETTRRRLLDQGLAARILCLKGEARTALLHALEQEAPDLVVLSPKGQGGRRCSDLSIGSTASYLIDHLGGPVLLVKADKAPGARHLPMAPGGRMPGSACAA